ncbi:MAG: hypothetical protein H7144_15820 [Burkholderiales bacterium]|nr:hypothetical protein [Phycisphaerae bacterium]
MANLHRADAWRARQHVSGRFYQSTAFVREHGVIFLAISSSRRAIRRFSSQRLDDAASVARCMVSGIFCRTGESFRKEIAMSVPYFRMSDANLLTWSNSFSQHLTAMPAVFAHPSSGNRSLRVRGTQRRVERYSADHLARQDGVRNSDIPR